MTCTSPTASAAPDWKPYEAVDNDGNHVGIAADFTALMAQRGGFVLETVPTRSRTESLEYLQHTLVPGI